MSRLKVRRIFCVRCWKKIEKQHTFEVAENLLCLKLEEKHPDRYIFLVSYGSVHNAGA